jgi:hypothetical protein
VADAEPAERVEQAAHGASRTGRRLPVFPDPILVFAESILDIEFCATILDMALGVKDG